MLVRNAIAAGSLALVWPAAASAQDATVALNPTLMVGNAGVAAAGQHARQAQGGGARAGDAAARAQARKVCGNLDWYAKQPRATPAKMQKMTQLCHQLGF